METGKATERSNIRELVWLDYMRAHANDDGYWHSSRRARSGLPMTEGLTDEARVKAIRRMVLGGRLLHVRRGFYYPIGDEDSEKT